MSCHTDDQQVLESHVTERVCLTRTEMCKQHEMNSNVSKVLTAVIAVFKCPPLTCSRCPVLSLTSICSICVSRVDMTISSYYFKPKEETFYNVGL